jgi:hypothetical protein
MAEASPVNSYASTNGYYLQTVRALESIISIIYSFESFVFQTATKDSLPPELLRVIQKKLWDILYYPILGALSLFYSLCYAKNICVHYISIECSLDLPSLFHSLCQ